MQNFLEMLGWALLHSVAPLAAAGLISCALLAVAGSSPPALRYRIAASGLFVCFAMFGAIFLSRLLPNVTPVGTVASLAAEPTKTGAAGFQWHFDAASLAVGWFILVLFMACRLGMQHVRASRFRKSAPLADRRASEQVADIAATLAISPPIVRVSMKISSPFVCGLIRPTLILPSNYFETLRADSARAVLNHELQHIRRKDVFAACLQSFLCGLMYLHPAIIILNRVIDAEREKICDRAAAPCPSGRKALAHGLADLAQVGINNPRPAAAHSIGDACTLLERIALLSGRQTAQIFTSNNSLRMTRAMMLLTGFCVTGFFATMTATGAGPISHTEGTGGRNYAPISKTITDTQKATFGQGSAPSNKLWNSDSDQAAIQINVASRADKLVHADALQDPISRTAGPSEPNVITIGTPGRRLDAEQGLLTDRIVHETAHRERDKAHGERDLAHDQRDKMHRHRDRGRLLRDLTRSEV